MGCVFVLNARDDASGMPVACVAQPRMLLPEPAARGRGMGKLLVDACQCFAADAGCTRVRLWTYSLLLAAWAVYRRGGYGLCSINTHPSFGHPTVGEVWESELSG